MYCVKHVPEGALARILPPTKRLRWFSRGGTQISMEPLIPAFEPIALEQEDADDLAIVGEFVRTADRS